MRSTRTYLAAATTLLIAASAVPIAAAVTPSRPTDIAIAPVEWDVCEETAFVPALPENYSCALYPVPLDHGDPAGETIDLALVKRAADDGSARLGSLFVNPGGPGGSGFDLVAFAGDFLFDPSVTAAYDVIGFDPRGISASAGLRCFTGEENPGEYFDYFSWPDSASQLRTNKANAQRFEKICDKNTGELRDNMSSTDVSRDLEILRQAVGDEQLNFVGYSYGSYIAAVYANLYPDNVGAIIADGVIDPVEWATGDEPREARRVPTSARLNSDVGAQATLDEFFRLCDEAGPELCALAPDSAARYQATYDRLKAEPVVYSFPGSVIDDQTLVGLTLSFLYSSPAWYDLAQFLALFEQIAQTPSTSAQRVLARQIQAEVARTAIPPAYVGLEQFLGVICSDGQDPDKQQAWISAAADSTGYFGPLWSWSDSGCQTWRGRDADRFTGPFTAQTANPVLVASTRYDPATAYAGAVALHDYLPNSVLLTVEGWGHTTPFLSACGDQVTTAYLLRVPLSSAEIVCDQDIAPFPPLEEPAPESEPDVSTQRVAPGSTDDRVAQREAFVNLVNGFSPLG